jgi:hypothetical protein
MSKRRKIIDSNQASLFDLLKSYADERPAEIPIGSLNDDIQFRAAISEALRRCPLSRYQVAARMSELKGVEITKSMLDSWTAESKEQHRFPATYLNAFCAAVGSTEPFEMLARPIGLFVLPGPEALRAEIQRIDEEIGRKQAEKRRRLMFLKEMEGTK